MCTYLTTVGCMYTVTGLMREGKLNKASKPHGQAIGCCQKQSMLIIPLVVWTAILCCSQCKEYAWYGEQGCVVGVEYAWYGLQGCVVGVQYACDKVQDCDLVNKQQYYRCRNYRIQLSAGIIPGATTKTLTTPGHSIKQ